MRPMKGSSSMTRRWCGVGTALQQAGDRGAVAREIEEQRAEGGAGAEQDQQLGVLRQVGHDGEAAVVFEHAGRQLSAPGVASELLARLQHGRNAWRGELTTGVLE